MKNILFCAFLIQLGVSQAYPQGVGAFAYHDSAGNSGRRSVRSPRLFIGRRRAFKKNLEHQRLALNAAKKAYDLTSNQASFIPSFPDRFSPFSGFPFDYGMSGFGGPNSAFAGAAAGPDFTHHIDSINPSNPMMPNVNVYQSEQRRNGGGPGFVGVSSSSYSSSSNVNGLPQSTRGSETVINKDGKITRYAVHN